MSPGVREAICWGAPAAATLLLAGLQYHPVIAVLVGVFLICSFAHLRSQT